MKKDSRIFIAGHRGLVGSAIRKTLESRGYTNLLLRTRQELDLANKEAVLTFFKEENPEYVFLAAAKVGGIVANNKYRADFIYENLQIQNNVIHASYLQDVSKLLFLGSTCIYPKNAPQPIKEDYLLTDPLEYTNEPYAIAKIAGIKMCESYNLQYGTNFISVMPTNLYGPNDNFDLEKSHVLPALIRKFHLGKALHLGDWAMIKEDLNKLPIEHITGSASEDVILTILDKYGVRRHKDNVQVEIWGTGLPKREFLWSEEMAQACIYIMEHVDFKDLIPSDTSEVRNTHINIGSGTDISIRDLAEKIKETVGYNGTIHFNTDKPDGTMRKLTDVSKLNQLGWQNQVALDDGIKRLYHWYLQHAVHNA